jgi:PPOX class probable F420-dependent enzyme
VEEARGDAGVSRRLELQNRFYDRIRHRAARGAVEGPALSGNFDSLRGHKYCLLVTFRRDGTGVPTPVWFGLDEAGRLYFRTGADVAKVRRLRSHPGVLVAPCTLRGKPLGSSVEGTARVLGAEEREHAEQAIQSNYGLGRRLYEGGADAVGGDEAYVEVAPRLEQSAINSEESQ